MKVTFKEVYHWMKIQEEYKWKKIMKNDIHRVRHFINHGLNEDEFEIPSRYARKSENYKYITEKRLAEKYIEEHKVDELRKIIRGEILKENKEQW